MKIKTALLAVLLLAGCQEKGTNRIEINGQVIEGENITIRNLEEDTVTYMIGKIHDTIYVPDTVILHDTIIIQQDTIYIKQ